VTEQTKPLNCTIEEKDGQPLTVAEKFLVHCVGNVPESVKDKLIVIDPPADKGPSHVLRIIEVRNKTENSLDLVGVSYRPGSHADILVKVTDGDNVLELSGLSFTVNSILKPNEQAQMEPSVGPFVLGFPIVFYIVLIGFLAMSLVTAIVTYGRRKIVKKREQEMTSLLISEDCGKVFHRECRKLTKVPDLVKRIEHLDLEVRHFLVRRLFVPAHLPKMDLALQMIRRNHKEVNQNCSVLIRKLFGELQKAKGKILTQEDCDQLFREARNLVDEVEKQFKNSGGAK
jgi:hypothetical protein